MPRQVSLDHLTCTTPGQVCPAASATSHAVCMECKGSPTNILRWVTDDDSFIRASPLHRWAWNTGKAEQCASSCKARHITTFPTNESPWRAGCGLGGNGVHTLPCCTTLGAYAYFCIYIYTKIYILYIYKYIYSVQAWWKEPHLQKARNPTVAQAFQPGQ